MARSPVLLDIPHQIFTTRLLLRAPQPGDGQIIHAAINQSLESLRPWMDWAQRRQPVQQSEANTRAALSRFYTREELRFLMFRRTDQLLVGVCGLQNIDWTVPRMEIGYWLRANQQGQGYMTEAVIALTDFARDVLGAARVEILCDARNQRSAAVAERAGYVFEGKLRCERRAPDGSLADTLVYARLAKE